MTSMYIKIWFWLYSSAPSFDLYEEPRLVVSYLQALKSSEESVKEQVVLIVGYNFLNEYTVHQ